MRTMAGFVIFSVVVSSFLLQVYASECFLEKIRNCNECIRCGGYWCIKGETQHCAPSKNDNWCPGENNIEELPSIKQDSRAGEAISPVFITTTAVVGWGSPRIMFKHNRSSTISPSVNPEVSLSVINSTQRLNYETAENITKCDKDGVCTTYLSIMPTTEFCKDDGGKFEFLNMRLTVQNVTEQAMVKYHVPCACSCSDHVQRNAPVCNGHGDFSCGVCLCHTGWTGDFCDSRPECGNKRGDVQCSNPYKSDVTCSGNGECGVCDTCICYTEGDGSQYFDPDNYCADLPLIISLECETCLHDEHIIDGKCPECSAIMQTCNETLLEEVDEEGRKVWVHFEDYAAMKDAYGQIYIMRKSTCKGVFGGFQRGQVNVTVPTILGIVAVLALVTAAAGYVVWKARAAQTPLNASQYQELDGPENSAGINPLYKPPTSSYNNPLWKGGAKV